MPTGFDPGGVSMYRFIASVVVVLFALSTGFAEEFAGRITKFEDGKLTFLKGFGFKKGQNDEEQIFAVDAKCKLLKAKFRKGERKIDVDGAYEGGRERFEKRVRDAAKGNPKNLANAVFVQIITTGEGEKARVTEIRVFPEFGEGKKGPK